MTARVDRAGFTLLEMLVVLVITGIALTMALPAIDRGEMRLHGATREAAARLMSAQRTAVLQQHDVAILFDTARGAMWRHEDRDNDGAVDAGEGMMEYEVGQGVRYGRASAPAAAIGGGAVTFEAERNGMPVIVFHRNGSASEWGGFYLNADSRQGTAAAAVLVDRATGRAWALTYNGDAWVRSD